MEPVLVQRLLALNRAFYAGQALSFSETRPPARLDLAPIMPYLGGAAKLLDLGCGNGRLAERLAAQVLPLYYLGLDMTPALIEIARARLTPLTAPNFDFEFRVVDLADPPWIERVRDRSPFDLAIALGVLHHLPGRILRATVVRDLHSLMRPSGVLVMSNWQFLRNERLRKRIVPWTELAIHAQELEEGDALLDWRRGGPALRYCHQLTTGEVEQLAAASGWTVLDQFVGQAGLNLWSVLTV